ncbi:putative transporter [Verrucomicrobium sp. BvORR106]|uniref:putative transporter n=1 Tax=Verrucomicrobium sp. BvORR106 TaxID=1403819 RepID=UPI000571C4BE|nr:putative transporter [Verrucomicrobium sp. BvORR106]
MSWLLELNETQPIPHAMALMALVCVAGMALGSIRVRGVKLGTAGVLFAGILVGHFVDAVDSHVIAFVKEFGLVLFVFTIGLQLGPGFFAALRKQGMKLNLLTAAVVVMGAVIAALSGWLAGFDPAAVLGVFSGGSTNTPSLGAGTQTLGMLPEVSADRMALPALAYAVTYPAATLGIIVTLMLLPRLLKINVAQEAEEFAAMNKVQADPLERRTLEVTQSDMAGVAVGTLAARVEAGVTFSRIRHAGVVEPATDETILHVGDLLVVVGPLRGVEAMERVIGRRSEEDLVLDQSTVTFRRVVVTDRKVLGKPVGELHLDRRYHVAVTRVTRADLEMSAVPGLRLQYGDQLQLVGRKEDLDLAAEAVGNSLKELSETHFIPFFIGLAVGILLGTMPIPIPGLPHPVRLGLAGGPLIAALILGRVGRIRRQVWHMPVNTNLAFREFGIALFFAAVGLSAGAKFFETIVSATGAMWLLAGVCVTVVPLVTVAVFARLVLRMNYMDLSGLVAGSMTDPPALAFASNMASSDAPAVAYATVFPFTTLLRILSAQVLAITLCT